jgi:hypothetical protein
MMLNLIKVRFLGGGSFPPDEILIVNTITLFSVQDLLLFRIQELTRCYEIVMINL